MIGERALAQVVDMSGEDCRDLLNRVSYAHLGLAVDDESYVIPIHFAYDEPVIYFFTTEGKKTDMIARNRRVCLQAEYVTDARNWQSVIVTGDAELLQAGADRDRALARVKASTPTLTPAWSIRWMDQWARINVDAVYKITPLVITGRKTTKW